MLGLGRRDTSSTVDLASIADSNLSRQRCCVPLLEDVDHVSEAATEDLQACHRRLWGRTDGTVRDRRPNRLP
jgi:hypothetical protein